MMIGIKLYPQGDTKELGNPEVSFMPAPALLFTSCLSLKKAHVDLELTSYP